MKHFLWDLDYINEKLNGEGGASLQSRERRVNEVYMIPFVKRKAWQSAQPRIELWQLIILEVNLTVFGTFILTTGK